MLSFKIIALTFGLSVSVYAQANCADGFVHPGNPNNVGGCDQICVPNDGEYCPGNSCNSGLGLTVTTPESNNFESAVTNAAVLPTFAVEADARKVAGRKRRWDVGVRKFVMFVSKWLSIVAAASTSFAAAYIRNDNYIFNAVTSALRQWGSSLNHNGMSYFMASIPEGTVLYHGRGNNSTVTWTEWFAFEPEHAINFALGPRRHHNPPKKPPGEKTLPELNPRYSAQHPSAEGLRFQHPASGIQRSRLPLGAKGNDVPEFGSGYFQTYVAKRKLSVLYIDGTSAGKTDMGTLDTQDLVLINRTCMDCPWMGESERAEHLCRINRERWNNKLDGFLRMETGFEIIICDAGRSLEFVDQVQTNMSYQFGFHTWSWMEAGSARYWSIGGGRASIDFGNMVTAFAIHDTDLFDGHSQPRLRHLPSSIRENLFLQVDGLVMNYSAREHSADLQAMADMIVSRYALRLETLRRTDWKSVKDLHLEIMSVYSPFIDHSHRDKDQEIGRCYRQSLSYRTFHNPVGKAIESISFRICTTLFDLLETQDLVSATKMIRNLYEYLDWVVWKDCRGCQAGQICLVPMWPFGSKADHDEPHCRDRQDALDQHGYWRMVRPNEVS